MQTDHLEAELARLHAEQDFSGTVLITEAGRTVFEAHMGLADRAAGIPVGPRHRFALGSITKLFTAIAVLDVVAAGTLDLDGRSPRSSRPNVAPRRSAPT
jgi:CubicO group peptidase (beta-lactamase class C family)